MTDQGDNGRSDPVLRLLQQHYEIPKSDPDRMWKRIRSVSERQEADEVTAAPWRRGRRWLAAAIIVLVAGGTLSMRSVRTSLAEEIAPPVRAWAADRLAILDAIFTKEAPQTPPAVSNVPGPVSLVPTNSLDVAIDRCQTGGRLEIHRHGADVAILSMADSADFDGVMLHAGTDGFRLQNTPEATASYRLLVPRTLRHVTIRMGERPVQLPIRIAEPTGWVLYLQAADERDIGHCQE